MRQIIRAVLVAFALALGAPAATLLAPPAQAEVRDAPVAAPPPEPEVQRGGIFGWSYDRRPKE